MVNYNIDTGKKRRIDAVSTSVAQGISVTATIFRAAMKLRRYIGQLMETEIVKELTAAVLHVGLPEEKIVRTIQNGFKCGRC